MSYNVMCCCGIMELHDVHLLKPADLIVEDIDMWYESGRPALLLVTDVRKPKPGCGLQAFKKYVLKHKLGKFSPITKSRNLNTYNMVSATILHIDRYKWEKHATKLERQAEKPVEKKWDSTNLAELSVWMDQYRRG